MMISIKYSGILPMRSVLFIQIQIKPSYKQIAPQLNAVGQFAIIAVIMRSLAQLQYNHIIAITPDRLAIHKGSVF